MIRGLLTTAVCSVLIVPLSSCRVSSHGGERPRPVAVLGAFDREVRLLDEMLTDVQPRQVEGIEFVSGRLSGRPVVVAWTGVGKVNAAMVTTLLLEHYRPSRVIFTGIAGAVDPNLSPGDIVIAKETAHHDMGMFWSDGFEPGGVRNRLTGADNPVFFPADPNLLTVAQEAGKHVALNPVALKAGPRTPRVVLGTVVTGDAFVASQPKCEELAETLGADAVEMEGAAVAQVCYQRGIGHLVIRSIADRADEGAVLDKQKFYLIAAENSATLVAAVVERMDVQAEPDGRTP